jgi:hypothetical protein
MTNKDAKEQVESIAHTFGDTFSIVLARVKQYLEQSARGYVDLSKLFSLIHIKPAVTASVR